MSAKVTFLNDAFQVCVCKFRSTLGDGLIGGLIGIPPIEVPRPIGTCGHTITAPDAELIVDKDNSLFVIERRSDRANFDTRGILTVHAGAGKVIFSGIRIVLNLRNLYPLLAFWHVVGQIASPSTSLASNASLQIYYHAPSS